MSTIKSKTYSSGEDVFEEAAYAVTHKRFDKKDFALSFPQYADMDYEDLLDLDSDEQHEISVWFYLKSDDISRW